MGADPVPYSVSKNRASIEMLFRLCSEQGIIARELAVEELFPTAFD